MSTAVLHHQPVHKQAAPSRGPGSGQGRHVEPAQAQPARSGQLLAARAQALFTSGLSARCEHTQIEVAAAIRRAFRTHNGARGCVAEVAAAYGEDPETAARRMRWARAVIHCIDDFEAALDDGADGAAGPAERKYWCVNLCRWEEDTRYCCVVVWCQLVTAAAGWRIGHAARTPDGTHSGCCRCGCRGSAG
jgi:hypothetical protein